jgi:hypothetical protein
VVAPVVPTETLKAPQSWKPAAREAWAKLPAEAQAEVVRREKETYAREQEMAPMRRSVEQMQQVLAPHARLFQEEGLEPLQGVSTVLQAFSDLRTGSPERKVGLLATLIRQSRVDVQQLASALDAEPQQGQAQAPQQQFHDPRFDAFMGQLQQRAQERQQATQAKVHQDIADFAARNEHFEDVKPTMRAILRDAAENGQKVSLQEAYDQACWATSGVRAKLQGAQQAATSTAEATQRARAASSSLKSQPASVSGGAAKPNGRRAAIEAAAAALDKSR